MANKNLKLNPLDFAISWGLIAGIIVFLITMIGLLGFEKIFLGTLLLFREMYGRIGYTMTPLGAILGAFYAFVDAFIITFLFAWIYNKLLNREK